MKNTYAKQSILRKVAIILLLCLSIVFASLGAATLLSSQLASAATTQRLLTTSLTTLLTLAKTLQATVTT